MLIEDSAISTSRHSLLSWLLNLYTTHPKRKFEKVQGFFEVRKHLIYGDVLRFDHLIVDLSLYPIMGYVGVIWSRLVQGIFLIDQECLDCCIAEEWCSPVDGLGQTGAGTTGKFLVLPHRLPGILPPLKELQQLVVFLLSSSRQRQQSQRIALWLSIWCRDSQRSLNLSTSRDWPKIHRVWDQNESCFSVIARLF